MHHRSDDGDLVLHGGRVRTLEDGRAPAEALWIRGGRVAAAGTDDEILSAAPASAHRIALEGACVLPGLVDAHLHFEGFALGLTRIDADLPRLEDVLRAVGDRAAATPPGEWILGHGWNHNRWGSGELPTRQLLDGAAPDHPVFLTAKSGHASWANTAALNAAGVTRRSQDPAGGTVVRDGAGEPTGVFLEAASGLVAGRLPEVTAEQVADAMAAALPVAWACGLTGVHDLDGIRALRAWQILRERGHRRLRVCKSIPSSRLDEAIGTGLRSGFGDDMLWIGGVKLFADGALGPRTAWMLAPYENEPGNLGMPLMAPEELRETVTRASRHGLACFVHAIGDRANREALDALALARAEEEGSGRRLRHRIEHVQVIDPRDAPRFAELRVIASVQPVHATSDYPMVDRFWGRERGRWAYAFESLRRAGAVLAFGSDTPVEPIPPLAGIHAAVTRRREDGSPGAEGWQPQEKLSVAEAIRGFTKGAAFAGGVEDRLGSLAPGMLADLVVLAEDPFAVDPMDLAGLPALATLVAGRFVHADPALGLDRFCCTPASGDPAAADPPPGGSP